MFQAKLKHRALGISCFGATIVVDRLASFVDRMHEASQSFAD